MPDRGLLTPTALQHARLTATEPLVLQDARLLQVTFEVEREAALSHLPPATGRPIPPYGRLLVATAGGVALAVLSVGGRYRMMPRNVTVAAVQSGGLDASGLFGSGSMRGSVAIDRAGAVVEASVSGPEGLLALVSLPATYAVEPAMLRWDTYLALGRDDGRAVLAEVTQAHGTTDAFLSKNATLTAGPGLPGTHPWAALRSIGVISACYAEGTLRFGAPETQEAWD